ncbi:MAG TPA: exosortase K [Polyangiaceae bacterium]|nr:exosortase K [Polyangiaceae bacterium]
MNAVCTAVAHPAARRHGPARHLVGRFTLLDAAVLAPVVASAYALKRFYSTASAEELHWALGPTTRLVEYLTRAHFAPEAGAGFVSDSRHLVIAPACAGVNFLVIALLSLTFGFVTEVHTAARKLSLVVVSGLVAYAAMLVVNALRIAFGMFVASCWWPGAAYRPELHRIEGIATYLVALWLLAAGARRVVGRTER